MYWSDLTALLPSRGVAAVEPHLFRRTNVLSFDRSNTYSLELYCKWRIYVRVTCEDSHWWSPSVSVKRKPVFRDFLFVCFLTCPYFSSIFSKVPVRLLLVCFFFWFVSVLWLVSWFSFFFSFTPEEDSSVKTPFCFRIVSSFGE